MNKRALETLNRVTNWLMISPTTIIKQNMLNELHEVKQALKPQLVSLELHQLCVEDVIEIAKAIEFYDFGSLSVMNTTMVAVFRLGNDIEVVDVEDFEAEDHKHGEALEKRLNTGEYTCFSVLEVYNEVKRLNKLICEPIRDKVGL